MDTQAGFKGSCSTLWTPNSFWEASQPYQGRRLRLHRVPPIPQTEHAPGVSTSSEEGSRGLDILGENPVAKRTIEMLIAFKQRSARSLWYATFGCTRAVMHRVWQQEYTWCLITLKVL